VTAGNQNELSECNANFRRDRVESRSERIAPKKKRKSTSNSETEGSEGTAVSQTTTENEDSGLVESIVKRVRQRRSWAELNRSFTCSYEGCDRKYASNHALTLHERKKHENGGVFSTLRSVPQHWSHSSQQLQASQQHSSSQNYGNNQHHSNVPNEVYSSNISQQTTQSSEDSSSPHSQQRDSRSSIALPTKNRPQNNSRQLTTQHINSQTARNSRDGYGRPSFAPQAVYRAPFCSQTTQNAGDLDARPSIAHGELSFAEHHSFLNEKCNHDSEAQDSGDGRQGGRKQDNYQSRMQVSQLALQYSGEPQNAQPQYETYKGYGDSGTAQRPQHGNLNWYLSLLNNTVCTTNTQENLSRTLSLANNAKMSIGNRTMKQGGHAWNRGDNNLRWFG
ncbi:hypothetical protein SARC_07682, partial [Sphaeroforma arctica JP610]